MMVCNHSEKGDSTKADECPPPPPPRKRQELLSFLGLATYMSMFVENVNGLSTTLRELREINVTFRLSDEQQEAFEAIKEAVSAEVTLNYFDPLKPITLQVDASMAGLGTILFQLIKKTDQSPSPAEPLLRQKVDVPTSTSRGRCLPSSSVVRVSTISYSAKISTLNPTTSHLRRFT